MTVTLTNTKINPDDNTWDIEAMGISFKNGRVAVKIRFENGGERVIEYENARLIALRNRVAQFSGLKAAMEADIAANEPGMDGSVT